MEFGELKKIILFNIKQKALKVFWIISLLFGIYPCNTEHF